ncbi:hypothetical protein ACFWA5_16640 [Streptomyces mirabilis]|uniref:hypothetical protein n=1 Tax=Streptomyces mirabilis TaxID=68239 RepID=UPI0036541896
MRKLLAPHTTRIGRPDGPAQPDAIGIEHLGGSPTDLARDLTELLGSEQVLHRLSDLVRYASDASPYRLLPQVVVRPRDAADVAALLDYCRRTGRHTTRDSITWCRDLLPHLSVNRKLETVALHPTCSTTHLGLNRDLKAVASFLADTTVVPVGTTCCGTAGDCGLLHPELVVSATRDEKAGLDASPAQAYLSANRTCEMGLRQATGQPYESFIFLLEELTRSS